MKVTYLCPHCRGAINAGNNIILSVRTLTHEVGLVLLHEELGNYSSEVSSSLSLENGEVVDVFCPICHKSLNVQGQDNLAKYIRIGEDCEECFIVISRRYGEKITFKVSDDKKVETYGERLVRFINPDWFL